MFNNDLAIQEVNGEAEAYEVIEKELGIKPVKLGYMPNGMILSDLSIVKGNAILKFQYQSNLLYLACISNDEETSLNYQSDAQIYKRVRNAWLGEEVGIRREITKDGVIKYEAQLVDQNVVYEVVGELPEEEFLKIVERLYKFEN